MRTITTSLAGLALFISSGIALSAQSVGTEIDKALDGIAAYKYGMSRANLIKAGGLIRRLSANAEERAAVERKLVAILRSDATRACKDFVCRQLAIIGSDRAVPALAALLDDATLADMARYALERIPGPASDKALINALRRMRGKAKVGITNSLGERGSATPRGTSRRITEALLPLLRASDASVRAAAATALGKIGDASAIDALMAEEERASPKVRALVADALLRSADRCVADGDPRRAEAIYNKLYASSRPAYVRAAALRGLVASGSANATSLAVAALRGRNAELRNLAWTCIRKISGPEATKAFASLLPELSASDQVQMIEALADRGDAGALAAVVAAVRRKDQGVRGSALGALGRLGDRSTVSLLAKAAAAGNDAARRSLRRLRGAGIETEMRKCLAQAAGPVQVELIRALAARDCRAAVPTLRQTAQSENTSVRVESWKALGALASGADVPALVDLLLKVREGRVHREAEKAVAAAARRIGDEQKRSDAVLAALKSAQDTAVQASLLRTLARIGNSAALAAIKAAIKDSNPEVQNAAIRALAEWPNARPMDDLLLIAQHSPNAIRRVLALRGYVRLAGLPSRRKPGDTVKRYEAIMQVAQRPEDKRLVLSALASVKDRAALEMAKQYLSDEGIKNEAAAAVVKVAKAISDRHPDAAKEALQLVIGGESLAERIRKDAQKAVANIGFRKKRRKRAKGSVPDNYANYITMWQVAGPYKRQGKNVMELFDVAFPPERGKDVDWKDVKPAPDPRKAWYVPLEDIIGGTNRVAYLRTAIVSPTAQKAKLELGSDDGIKVWLNGEVVHSNKTHRPLKPAEDTAAVKLRKGRNLLMMKITQGGGHWAACARVCAPDGNKIEELRVQKPE